MTRNAAMLVLCALLAAAIPVARSAAYPTTIGLRYESFTLVSNVTGYTNMTQDYCQIEKLIEAGDYAGALKVYLNGSNSVSGTSLRKFETWAATEHQGEPTFDMLAAYHKNGTWADDKIKAAFAAQQGARVLSLIALAVHYKYGFHEVDAAYTGTKAGRTNATNGSPHNLDEAWAIFAGVHPDACSTVLSVAEEMAEDMGMTYAGKAPVNWAIIVLMNDLQASAFVGNATDNLVEYNTTRLALRHQMATLMAQGVMRMAYASDLYTQCNKTAAASDSKHVAWSFWDVLAPQLAAWNATTTQTTAVTTALNATPIKYSNVVSALVPILGEINPKDLGVPDYAAINTDPTCARPAL